MPANRHTSETPATVAKRLSDLILCFPSAAAGGVQWKTLVCKYNERHSTTLDIAALGHSSALAAATALLWETLRLVDSKDEHNPVVAIEDGAAMTAQPDASATWPSLYKSLCEIVTENGFIEEEMSGDEIAHAVLVSQLKPLLQRHWHTNFDEGSLSYITDQGKFVRVKKMKHLLQALMQWREQRTACCKHTGLDEALELRLELVPSKKHNDLLLRCVVPRSCPSTSCRSTSTDCQSVASDTVVSETTSASTGDATNLMDQIAILRAENASLRTKNCILEQQVQHEMPQKEALFIPVNPGTPELRNVWDDPSEPPPFEYRGSAATPSASTAVPSDFGFHSGEVTPFAMASGTHSHPASTTPTITTWVWDGQNGQLCAAVPMWYVVGDRGLHNIPSGVVQQAVGIWESNKDKVPPSYFTMGARENGEC